jgi:hypothetical protein
MLSDWKGIGGNKIRIDICSCFIAKKLNKKNPGGVWHLNKTDSL